LLITIVILISARTAHGVLKAPQFLSGSTHKLKPSFYYCVLTFASAILQRLC